jgi:NADPH2:quinone reductase
MGAHGVIVAANEGDMAGVPAKVRAIAPRGVPIVYDGTGASTFRASLASLSPFGLLISFGNAGGVVPPVDIGELGRMGSLGIQRPSLFTMMADARERKEASQAVFQAFKENRIPAHIHAKLPLHEAAEAHRILESRKSMGSIVLIP